MTDRADGSTTGGAVASSREFMEMAKDNLRKDKVVATIVFLFREGDEPVPVLADYSNDEQKRHFYDEALPSLVKAEQADGVLVIGSVLPHASGRALWPPVQAAARRRGRQGLCPAMAGLVPRQEADESRILTTNRRSQRLKSGAAPKMSRLVTSRRYSLIRKQSASSGRAPEQPLLRQPVLLRRQVTGVSHLGQAFKFLHKRGRVRRVRNAEHGVCQTNRGGERGTRRS